VNRAAPLTALAGAVVIWATTFVVSADALATASPAVLTVARFALAVTVLVPLAARLAGWDALRRVLGSARTAALGLTGVAAYYGLQNLGLDYTTAGTAALLQAVLPVATAALAAVVLPERLTPGTAAGLVLATVGVVLVASADAQVDRGAVLVVSGVIAYAVYTVLLRSGRSQSPGDGSRTTHTSAGVVKPDSLGDSVALAAATAIWGLGFLLPWQAWEVVAGRSALPVGAYAVADTLYLGLVGSGGTLLLWTYGASRTPASVSGVLTAAIPALGYAFAVATGEPASWLKTVGGALALVGVLLAARATTYRSALGADGRSRATEGLATDRL
jgi:drug/metabolite transporter (DMT)-like permease